MDISPILNDIFKPSMKIRNSKKKNTNNNQILITTINHKTNYSRRYIINIVHMYNLFSIGFVLIATNQYNKMCR